ncbi:hypothetical protein E5288_WYG019876 [Bos mutus]|uniref:Uncharacterized protein n=1 Tax=Bos mutus TaxID=72004 RepID=A0A6B0RUI8_9CETA|nr:hypothetical protein [Bos mutus]
MFVNEVTGLVSSITWEPQWKRTKVVILGEFWNGKCSSDLVARCSLHVKRMAFSIDLLKRYTPNAFITTEVSAFSVLKQSRNLLALTSLIMCYLYGSVSASENGTVLCIQLGPNEEQATRRSGADASLLDAYTLEWSGCVTRDAHTRSGADASLLDAHTQSGADASLLDAHTRSGADASLGMPTPGVERMRHSWDAHTGVERTRHSWVPTPGVERMRHSWVPTPGVERTRHSWMPPRSLNLNVQKTKNLKSDLPASSSALENRYIWSPGNKSIHIKNMFPTSGKWDNLLFIYFPIYREKVTFSGPTDFETPSKGNVECTLQVWSFVLRVFSNFLR